MRKFSSAPLLLMFLLSNSFADVSPSTDEIFAAENVQGVLGCAALVPENDRRDSDPYCGRAVATFDPQSGKSTGMKAPKHIYLTGGEGIGDVFVYDQKQESATDSYFLVDSDEGRVWVRAKAKDLYALDAAMPNDSGGTSTKFDLNPRLREVYLTKDGKQPIPVENIFALKNNPNEQIGVVEIVLNEEEARNPKSNQSIRFSYPYHGERTLNAYELFEARKDVVRVEDPAQDPSEVELPVFRRSGDRYLVQIPELWAGLLRDGNNVRLRGALKSSASDFEIGTYGWIESKGISLSWRAGAEPLPIYQEESPSVQFRMERGPVFERNDMRWTSLKIIALYLDFDTPQPEDNYGVIRRQEVLLREVFLPLYDEQKRIQFWTSWEPGC